MIKHILALGLAVGLMAVTWVSTPGYNLIDPETVSQAEVTMFPAEAASDSLFWRNVVERIK